MKSILNTPFIILFLLINLRPSIGYQDKIDLERTELQLIYKNEGFYETISDIKVHGDHLFIVDNRRHQLLKFLLNGNRLEFVTFIGRPGQGPGDLEFPIETSIWQGTIAVKDQVGISFFGNAGIFKHKFRIFSPRISFLFVNNNIYYATANPKKSTLIEAYSSEGSFYLLLGKSSLMSTIRLIKGCHLLQ